MIRRSTAFSLLIVVTLGVTAHRSYGANTPLRFPAPSQPGVQPLIVQADQVSTWQQGEQQIIALSGNVLFDDASRKVRARRALAWVDLAGAKETQVTRLTLFADGDVQVEKDGTTELGTNAIIEASSRGDMRVKAKGGKIQQQSLAESAFYQSARPFITNVTVMPVDPQQPIRQIANEAPANDPTGPVLPAPRTRTANAGPTGTPVQQPPPLEPTPGAGAPPATLPDGPPADLEGPITPPPGIIDLPIPPVVPSRIIDYAPRFASAPYQLKFLTLPSGEQAAVITGGIILTVRFPTGEVIDMEADRVVVWTKGGSTQELFGGSNQIGGANDKRQIEFYLSGNVEFRYAPKPKPVTAFDKPQAQIKVLRADRIYFDVTRNKAIAMNGDLEIQQPGLADAAHVKGQEIWQLSPEEFQAHQAEIFASKLPSNPGIKVTTDRARILQREATKRGFLGLPQPGPDGRTLTETEQIFEGRNIFLELADVPVFYLPYLRGDVNDPFGPFEGFGFRQDNVFGTQVLTTWDIFQLLGLESPAGQRARMYIDYLSERGPAGGATYNYSGVTMFGMDSFYYGVLKGYGVYDQGYDQIGGSRSEEFVPPAGRGRVFGRHFQDLDNFQFQSQVSYLSDHNFLEQYYKFEFDLEQNQETFGNLKWQEQNIALSLLVEKNFDRYWVNETQWLPRADLNWIGVSFWDRFTYNLRANAGYASSVVPVTPQDSPVPYPPELSPTDVAIDTGRFTLNQELALPLQLGPIKVAPYGVIDLTHYSQDLNGDETGRFYGGGGVRASMPLSRLYPEVTSELFNLNGINHKIVFSTNYFNTYTNVAYSELPQLDRLNDDATDQSARYIKPIQNWYLPANVATALQTSPLYDPQTYAIRRLIDNRTDTLDTIQVIQADIRQRWQTKRGFPGSEHIVDYITLDLSASFFPNPARDNFDESVAFMEYTASWNIGDRTTLLSSGWVDPFENGARYFTFGGQYSRPDNTSFFLGYRQIDPLQSRAITGSVTYVFSQKYAIAANATYDFGTQQSQQNSLILSRTGTDVRLAFGVNYDAIIQNFGVTFEIVPNIIASSLRTQGGLLSGSPR